MWLLPERRLARRKTESAGMDSRVQNDQFRVVSGPMMLAVRVMTGRDGAGRQLRTEAVMMAARGSRCARTAGGRSGPEPGRQQVGVVNRRQAIVEST